MTHSARGLEGIPPRLDNEFLDWFSVRLDAAWAVLPPQAPNEVLASYVKAGIGGCAWQQGTHWLAGLSEDEVAGVEFGRRLAFPPDYRSFLRRLHTVDRPRLCARYLTEAESPEVARAEGAVAVAFVERHRQHMALDKKPSFYNWLTDAQALDDQVAWLWEGLQFDVEHNNFWPMNWGPAPDVLDARKSRARELVEGAPQLIPVFRHRYLLAEPRAAGNPVFSVWQSDIVVYGADLRDYLLLEFMGLLGLEQADARSLAQGIRDRVHARFPTYQAIPFWGELLTH